MKAKVVKVSKVTPLHSTDASATYGAGIARKTKLSIIEERDSVLDNEIKVVEANHGNANVKATLGKTNVKILNKKKRRLTAAQLAFKGKFMGTDSPEVHIRKHTIEKWTHTFLVSKLILIAFLGLINLVLCMFAWNRGIIETNARFESQEITFEKTLYDDLQFRSTVADGGSVLAAKLLLTGSALQILSALIGALGATRVLDDLKHDHDGLGTPGQDMLQTYFYVSLSYILIITPYSLSLIYSPTVLIGLDESNLSGIYLKYSSYISVLGSMLTVLSLYPSLMIVTVYKMSHSFLESLSMILSCLSVGGVYLIVNFLESSQFLYSAELVLNTLNSKILLYTLYGLVALAFSQVFCSFLGFYGSFIENKTLLLVYICLMIVLLIIMVGFTAIITFISIDELINAQCSTIVRLISYEWWYEAVGCNKYGGSEVGAFVESHTTSKGTHFATASIGTSVRCPVDSNSVIAWEYNQINASEELLRGCIQLQCCELLIDKIKGTKFPLILGLGGYTIAGSLTVTAAAWLRNNVAITKENVLVTSWKTVIGFLGGIVLVTVSLSLILIWHMTQELNLTDSQNIINLAGITFIEGDVVPVLPDFCDNGFIDGLETDVDCGGSCKSCQLTQSCKVSDDCASDSCKFGICVVNYELTCNNTILDSAEADIDCGWDTCRNTCKDGSRCFSNLDCSSNACENNVCVSCQDGIMNDGESDIDCGVVSCFIHNSSQGLCQDGRTCQSKLNCQSGLCVDETCTSCTNGYKDGDESDVDCGGSCLQPCLVDESCLDDFDCSTGTCIDNVCAIRLNESILESTCLDANLSTELDVSCSDGNLSTLESDVDCGGYFCLKKGKFCTDGKACHGNSDCASGSCVKDSCVSCTNLVKDGHESDVDCGSTCDTKCGLNDKCNDSEDCINSLVCHNIDLQSDVYANQLAHGNSNSTILEFNGRCQSKLSLFQFHAKTTSLIFQSNSLNVFDEAFIFQVTDLNSSNTSKTWLGYCDAYIKLSIDGGAIGFASEIDDVTTFISSDKSKAIVNLYHDSILPNLKLVPVCSEDTENVLSLSAEYVENELCENFVESSVATNLELAIIPTVTTISFEVSSLVNQSCIYLESCEKIPLSDVRIYAWSNVNVSCVSKFEINNLVSNCTDECEEIGNSAQCYEQNSCCYTVQPAPCFNAELEVSEIRQITGESGRATLQWTEHEVLSSASSRLYSINLLLSAESFSPQEVVFLVKPGESLIEGNIVLQKRNIEDLPCRCQYFDESVENFSVQHFCRRLNNFVCFSVPVSGNCIDLNPYLIKCDDYLTFSPTLSPSISPTANPSKIPSSSPSLKPSAKPSTSPSLKPTNRPSSSPSLNPSSSPSVFPTLSPSKNPSKSPSNLPSSSPSKNPTDNPTTSPSSSPSLNPTKRPSFHPSSSPSLNPTKQPSDNPTGFPTKEPSMSPSLNPSNNPTNTPTGTPSILPTKSPHKPTKYPSTAPTGFPTRSPTYEGRTRCVTAVLYLTNEECELLGCPDTLCLLVPIDIFSENQTNACVGDWTEVFRQYDCGVEIDIGKEEFDATFGSTSILQYSVNGEPYVYYKRITEVEIGTSMYDSFISSFMLETSKLNSNFELYSTENDLTAGTNKWTNCPSISTNIGFPGICGQSESVSDRWCLGYCSADTQRGVIQFSLSLCSEVLKFGEEETEESDETNFYSFGGNLIDTETGTGMLADIYLYNTYVNRFSWRFVRPSFHTSVTPIISTGDETENDPILKTCGAQSTLLFQEDRSFIKSSTFEFASIPEGSYSIVFTYNKKLLPQEFSVVLKFTPLLADPYLTIEDSQKDNVYDSVLLETNSFRIVFTITMFQAPFQRANIFALGEEKDFVVTVEVAENSNSIIVKSFQSSKEVSCLIEISLGVSTSVEITYDDDEQELVVYSRDTLVCSGYAKRGISGATSTQKVWTSAPGLPKAVVDLSFLQVYQPQEISTAFQTVVANFLLSEDTIYNIELLRWVSRGQAKIMSTYRNVDNLDLSVNFKSTDDEGLTKSCTVGARLLTDGVCQCGNAFVTRNDQEFLNGNKRDVLSIREFKSSIYRFFISRSSVSPSAPTNDKWRADGRCGKRFPLSDGSQSRCPTSSITWPDGSSEIRACCSSKGFCSNKVVDCTCRYCIDFSTFLTSWEDSFRNDGLCRHETQKTVIDTTAHCPLEAVNWDSGLAVRPCCNEFGRCAQVSAADCTCENCLDYRMFNSSFIDTSSIQEGNNEPTENSDLIIQLFTAYGSAAFYLPNFNDPSAYFDGHVFNDERTDSSTHVRLFCIDSFEGTGRLAEYAKPHFFQFQQNMLSLSQNSCPGGSTCEMLTLDGFSLPRDFEVDVLNQMYLKRFDSNPIFATLEGAESDSMCKIVVGTKSMIDLATSELSVCFDTCNADIACKGIEITRLETYSLDKCYFLMDISTCTITQTNSLTIIYNIPGAFREPVTLYSAYDSLFEPDGDNVHLYKETENSLSKWYLDDDLFSYNGHFSLGIDWEVSTSLPTGVDIWLTDDVDQRSKVEDIQDITYSKLTFECEDDYYIRLPHQWLTEVECSCGALDRGMCALADLKECASVVLRYKHTDLCLTRRDYSLVVSQCDYSSLTDKWYFNANIETFEGLGRKVTSSSLIDEQEQFHIVINTTDTSKTYTSQAKSTLVCSEEDETCFCDGTVFYGKKTAFNEMIESGAFSSTAVSGSITCSNAGMGGDPATGFEKHCWCIQNKATSAFMYFDSADDGDVLVLNSISPSEEYCFDELPIPGIEPRLVLKSTEECAQFLLF